MRSFIGNEPLGSTLTIGFSQIYTLLAASHHGALSNPLIECCQLSIILTFNSLMAE